MTRVISALVLLAVVLSVLILAPVQATALLAVLVAALAATEVAGFAAKLNARVPPAFVAVAAMAVTVAFIHSTESPSPDGDELMATTMLVLILVAGVLSLAMGPPDAGTLTRAATLVMAPLYVGLPLGAIVWVRCFFGPWTTLWMLGTVVVSDSAQYYAGRAFGRRKLAPAVSPAKTVEGAVGGLVAAAVAGAIVGPRVLPDLAPLTGAGLGLVLAMAGIAGDLFESLLKRGAGVKDSSALIPGHGGVLDRIDAQLFAAPVFYLFLRHVA